MQTPDTLLMILTQACAPGQIVGLLTTAPAVVRHTQCWAAHSQTQTLSSQRLGFGAQTRPTRPQP